MNAAFVACKEKLEQDLHRAEVSFVNKNGHDWA